MKNLKNMRKTNKRSAGYKTKAELKKERKELRKQSKMEKKYLIGIYDDYRNEGSLNLLLNKISLKLIGTYSTEPIYTMYDLKEENNCVVETNGNNSIKVEVWEINSAGLNDIERSYSYYAQFEDYPQDYTKQEVISPFGETIMYFTNIVQPKENIIISGDWIEYSNYKKVIGDKKENIL